jgi:hypothetical protein
MEEFFYDLSSFAEDDVTMEGMSLVETIKRVKPTILIGKMIDLMSLIGRFVVQSVSAMQGRLSVWRAKQSI